MSAPVVKPQVFQLQVQEPRPHQAGVGNRKGKVMSKGVSTKCRLAAECPRHWRSGPNSYYFFQVTGSTSLLLSSVSLDREGPKEQGPGVSPVEDSGHSPVVLGRFVGLSRCQWGSGRGNTKDQFGEKAYVHLQAASNPCEVPQTVSFLFSAAIHCQGVLPRVTLWTGAQATGPFLAPWRVMAPVGPQWDPVSLGSHPQGGALHDLEHAFPPGRRAKGGTGEGPGAQCPAYPD